MKNRENLRKQRRWPGVVLSLFVPGFGLLRAGFPKRAIIWFLCIPIASFIAGILLALQQIPFSFAVVVLAASLIVYVAMLCDSFRMGQMKKSLWYLYFGILVLLFLLPSPIHIIFRTFVIPTGSMSPTLRGSDSSTGSDYVIADRLSYRFENPKRGDLIVFSTSEILDLMKYRADPEKEEFFVMPVVGLPGESITIAENKVSADGIILGKEDGIPPSVSYIAPSEIFPRGEENDTNFKVGENEYFVLGDNSRHALDSRFWGGVPRSSIYGKVTTIYHPFSRAGRISLNEEKLQSNPVAGGAAVTF